MIPKKYSGDELKINSAVLFGKLGTAVELQFLLKQSAVL